jgi:chemotaxis signal transduction protein
MGAKLWAVVCSGELSAAVLVNEARQLLQLAVPPHADQFEPAMAPDGSEVLRVDVERLLRALPEAEISRGSRADYSRTASVASCPHASGAVSYLLFEADTTYATPVDRVVHVVALQPATIVQLMRGDARLSFRGQSLPLVLLPAYSGREAVNAPQVAIVVAMPDGGLAAIAVHRVTAWAQGAAVQLGAMRAAAFGEFQTITVTRAGQRTTHMVLDLDQVAYMLA